MAAMSAADRAPGIPVRSDPNEFHPLEVIPFFRRWKCSPLRDIAYTFIWNSLLGSIFWALGGIFRPSSMSVQNLVTSVLIANAIGYTLHAMFLVTSRLGVDRWVRGQGAVVTAAYYTVVSTLGVVVGFTVVALAYDSQALQWILRPRWLAAMGVSSLLISNILAAIFFARERHARAEATLALERERSERIEREATLANLRALQAQIEPHFLFNTLANVESLVDADPAAAKRMLQSFNRFLRASLAATRTESTTLGADAELIGAYLDVLQERMGKRLAWQIDVPQELAGYALPPMLLQPVVENAIRHGLEPKVEGGQVALTARREGAQVRIDVADTGMGFAPTTRGGLGLANLRDRLRVLYGERAQLSIAENTPVGTLVTIALPA
jgi:LytS/YehU family sensor histidine kinase